MSVDYQIEATIDAMIGKLGTSLQAKIDAVNADAADEFVLEPVQGITFGQRSETPFPWIALLPEATTSPTDASGEIEFAHGIAVVTWVAEFAEEALVRKLIRYQRAVRETLLVGRQPGTAIGEGGFGLEFLRDLYGPVFEGGAEGAFLSWVRTTYTVRQLQFA